MTTRLIMIGCAFSACLVSVAPGGERQPGPALTDRDREAIETARHALNLSRADFGFAKDVAEPRTAWPGLRRMLSHPLELPGIAEEVLEAAREGTPGAVTRVQQRVGGPAAQEPGPAREGDSAPGVGPLGEELSDLWSAVWLANGRARQALSALTPNRRNALAADAFTGLLQIEDYPDRRPLVHSLGIPAGLVDRALREAHALDPAPGVDRYAEHVRDFSPERLQGAGAALTVFLRRWMDDRDRSAGIAWPAEPRRIATPAGAVVIGSHGDDQYREPAVLVVDPGGNDVYAGELGAANGLLDRTVAVILDLGGDDVYRSGGALGAGAALFGVSVVMDAAGDDTVDMAHVGWGGAQFGWSWVEDRDGNDTSRIGVFGQGAATEGVGVLYDVRGDDLYRAGAMAQGYGGVNGSGWLIDRAGHDVYSAGHRVPDTERHPDRFLSLAQGCSMGWRPAFGGGLGALVDLEGSDSYTADVYGQGVAYWYGAGFLLDAGGNDHYTVHHYGQGAGIHLSSGFLGDLGGDDTYQGSVLAQGCGHDYAVGMLVEGGGGDVYSGDHHVQGRGINNSLALLLDREGNDAYFAGQPHRALGAGNDGGHREYPSLALLLDHAGTDRFSLESRSGEFTLRPDIGVLIDGPLSAPPEKEAP